jgi:hypothetical protein
MYIHIYIYGNNNNLIQIPSIPYYVRYVYREGKCEDGVSRGKGAHVILYMWFIHVYNVDILSYMIYYIYVYYMYIYIYIYNMYVYYMYYIYIYIYIFT